MPRMMMEELIENTRNLNRKQLITHLKRYTSKELIKLARGVGYICNDNETKTVVLQKVLAYITIKRQEG